MIAVTILTFAVAGPLMTADRAIVAAQSARDQLTASYLAQEGIEYVRAMRDNEYLAAYHTGGVNISATAWNNFLTASVNQCRATTCLFDPSMTMGSGSGFSLSPCSGNSCTPLYLTQLSNGTYGYTEQSGGTVTHFTRTIQILDASPSGATDVRVVSSVSWDFHGTSYAVSLNDHLTPWQ